VAADTIESMPERPTYRLSILGCRSNHAEVREFESILRARGLERAGEGRRADLEIVHTCSVTGQAAAKSRNAVRRAVRRAERRPHAGAVLVTGCFASTDRDEAAAILGRADAVLPQDDGDRPGVPLADRLAARVDAWLAGRAAVTPPPAQTEPGRLVPLPVVPAAAGVAGHTRAELRIQDGCDAHCTFCIIPKIRRTLRSKEVSEAVREARGLVDRGHREIVLTGIFIGAYGHATALRRREDPGTRTSLAGRVAAVAGVRGLERLRISSMEPGDVDEALLDAMEAHRSVVVPHLHLPLQSGSDAVLRRMNRQYRRDDYMAMIEVVEERLGRPGLPPAVTTDVICGFPGETEADFERTIEVVRRVGYLHMHVFPYSARRGTAAARWTDLDVPMAERRARVRRLRAIEEDPADGLAIAFHRRLVGRRVRVIVERTTGPGTSGSGAGGAGRCDHYAMVEFEGPASRGAVVEVEVTDATPAGLLGRRVESAMRLPVLGIA